MTSMFQCLLFCKLTSVENPDVLLAASRSRILVFSLSSGNLISTWQSSQRPTAASSNAETTLPVDDRSERPAKRLRKSSPKQGSDSSSAEIVTEDAQTNPVKSSKRQIVESNVIKLAATSDDRYVVAVTDEDKSVRVLHLDSQGCLQQLSERSMPKRPCAIAFTPDHTRIICGDKFGDVYALPLLCNDSRKEALSPVESDDTAQERDTTKNPFVPSATLRTVHTQRNQEALRHQQNQKNQKTSKHAVDFERELLFGHVSLLTDLICLSIPRKPFANTQDRTYIISADRDEHIRVSRGMPQAHIIEGYCLGHTQFVSRLCIPGWDPQLLISGGGDDYLLVWDWLSNRVLHKIDLRKLTIDYVEQQRSVQERESEVAITDVQRNGPIAVSGIFALEVKSSSGDFRRQIAVVCEDVPAIFFFDACKDGNLLHVSTMPTDAALIALALSSDHSRIAYAIVVSQGTLSHPDLAVEDGSSKGTSIGILEYDALKGSWERNEGLVNTVDSAAGSVPALMDGIKGGQAGSESFLNSLETLRKRGRDEYDLV